MRTPLLLVALLLTPLASAALPWQPITIQVAHSHVGERQTWEVVESRPDGTSRFDTLVLLIESTGRVRDRFAIERDVETLRIDRYEGSEWVWAERCHAIRGGDEAVRRDLLHGPDTQESPVFDLDRFGVDGTFQVRSRDVATFHADRCEPRTFLGGASFKEGSRVRLGTLHPAEFVHEPDGPLAGILSEPAEAIRLDGRRALAFTFDIRELARMFAPEGATDIVGTARIVLADGVPGFAEFGFQVSDWAPDGTRGIHAETWRLTGLERAPPGAPAIAPFSGATVPRSWPAERMRPVERLAFDDSPFGFPFRYHEAWESAMLDPTTGLSAFLGRNPDAFLQRASFERGARDPDAPGVPSDGSWIITVCGETQCHGLRSFRVVLSTQPAVKVIRHHVEDHDIEPSPLPPGEKLRLMDMPTAERIMRTIDEPFAEWGGVLYVAGYGNPFEGPNAPWAGLIISDVAAKDPTRGDQSGRGAWFDLGHGRVGSLFVQDIDQTEGLAAGVVQVRPPSPFANDARNPTALTIPDGAALAVTAAAGLGLLALVVKALWALFTRLSPSDVLTNPIRAALYERIRGEPGVHRARLIDGSRVGNGATRHHLAQLIRHKLVFATEEGGYVRYFAAGDVEPARAAREAVLRAGRHREVYDLFAARPDATLREAAAHLGMSAPSVYRAKRKLAKAGLLPVPDSVEATRVEA